MFGRRLSKLNQETYGRGRKTYALDARQARQNWIPHFKGENEFQVIRVKKEFQILRAKKEFQILNSKKRIPRFKGQTELQVLKAKKISKF